MIKGLKFDLGSNPGSCSFMETNETFWVLLAVLVNHHQEFYKPKFKYLLRHNRLFYRRGPVASEHNPACICPECDINAFGHFMHYVRVR